MKIIAAAGVIVIILFLMQIVVSMINETIRECTAGSKTIAEDVRLHAGDIAIVMGNTSRLCNGDEVTVQGYSKSSDEYYVTRLGGYTSFWIKRTDIKRAE